ncbi:MAG: glycosyltransferase [Lachnospiraceae bacterium]|jgi:glycosyltransferase|nr:glycosyltransferase [Lachnospiraceae bacterium]
MHKPKISIITVTYNDKVHLKMTLDSLMSQTFTDYESIVVDGASEDGTIELLREYKEKMKGRMRFISEKDDGLYFAVNKGIEMAEGEIVGILFDRYANVEVLQKIVDTFEHTKCDVVHGDLFYLNEQGKAVRYWHMGEGRIQDGWMAGHPTLYVKMEVYKTYGVYNTIYRGGADYEFEVRIFKDGKLKISYIPEVLIYMFYGGTSSGNFKGYRRSFAEGVEALRALEVAHPVWINVKRVFIVIKQFFRRRELP